MTIAKTLERDFQRSAQAVPDSELPIILADDQPASSGLHYPNGEDAVWLDYDITKHEALQEIVRRIALWSKVCMTPRDGWAMVFSGKTGCGKSTLVGVVERWARLSLRLTDAQVERISEPALFDALITDKKSRQIQTCRVSKLLIIEDAGVKHVNHSAGWIHENYWQLIDQRHERGRTTIVTANKGMTDFAEWVGFRTWSRLLDAMHTHDFFVDFDALGVPDFREEAFYSTSLDDLVKAGVFA